MTVAVYAVLLVLGVTLLVVTAVRALVGGIAASPAPTTVRPRDSHPAARRILDARYAAGELSTDEYEHRLRVLEGED